MYGSPLFPTTCAAFAGGRGEASRPAAAVSRVRHCQVPAPLLVLRFWGRSLVAVPSVPDFY